MESDYDKPINIGSDRLVSINDISRYGNKDFWKEDIKDI